MNKTSHKKNRPFDFKLIDLVEPHPVLYMRQMPGMTSFDILKAKNKLWQDISSEMGFDTQFCINRWGNLRGQFQKEFRQSVELCPKTGLIRGTTWPYFDRLDFLKCTLQMNKKKKDKSSPKTETAKREENETVEECDQEQWYPEDSQTSFIIDPDEDETIMEIHTTDDITCPKIEEPSNIEESYIDSEYVIVEEIQEEEIQSEDENIDDTDRRLENLRKIQSLMASFEGESLKKIEKRLMAFLCKCQLRALSHQGIEDLQI